MIFFKISNEEITKEDALNITSNIFDTFLDYVGNSNEELEQLQQENKRLKIQVSAREEVANEYKKVIDKIFSRITLWKMEDITMETAKVLDDLLSMFKEVSE